MTLDLGSLPASYPNRLLREGIEYIAKSLELNHCLLQHLHLSGASLANQDLNRLAKALDVYQRLYTLDISGNRIEGE